MRARAVVGVACSMLSCGRIGFDPGDLPGDGPVDAVPLPAGPFGTPVALPINSGSVDVDPSMTADGLQLFFCSNRGGDFDIYVSVRATVSDPWPAPAVVDSGNISMAGVVEQDSVISSDGLTLYFTRSGDIYQATRQAPAGPFGTPSPIDELNTSDADVVSAITSDGLALTFHSTRPGGLGGSDIYLATRDLLGSPWTVIGAIPGAINGSNAETDSFLWGDRLTLFFDSNRPGGLSYNIYMARRSSVTDSFDIGALVSELDLDQHQADSWLSTDGRTILFASGALLIDLDIYEARR